MTGIGKHPVGTVEHSDGGFSTVRLRYRAVAFSRTSVYDGVVVRTIDRKPIRRKTADDGDGGRDNSNAINRTRSRTTTERCSYGPDRVHAHVKASRDAARVTRVYNGAYVAMPCGTRFRHPRARSHATRACTASLGRGHEHHAPFCPAVYAHGLRVCVVYVCTTSGRAGARARIN